MVNWLLDDKMIYYLQATVSLSNDKSIDPGDVTAQVNGYPMSLYSTVVIYYIYKVVSRQTVSSQNGNTDRLSSSALLLH